MFHICSRAREIGAERGRTCKRHSVRSEGLAITELKLRATSFVLPLENLGVQCRKEPEGVGRSQPFISQ